MSSPKQVPEESFEVERIQLLKQINDLEQSWGLSPEDDTRLHLYRAQYNQVVDRIYPSIPRADPLVRLPSDVWIPILQEVMRNTFGSWLGYSPKILLPLTLVSCRWRQCIMETPILWSNISLDDEDSSGQDTDILLATCLYLSQSCDIALFFQLPVPSWDRVRDVLAIHRSRIKHIVFHCNEFFRPSFHSKSSSILRYLSPLTHLETITGQASNTHWLLEQGTPLKHVYSDRLSAPTLSLPAAHHLRHFETAEELQVILPLSRNLHHVQSVCFINAIYVSSEQPRIEMEEFDTRIPAFLDWTSLSYSQYARHFPLWLLDRFPQLQKLELLLSFQQIGNLFTKCSHLLCLETLTLRLTFDQDEPLTLPSDLSVFPSLRHLSFRGPRHRHIELSSHFHQLYKLLVKALVNLTSLTMFGETFVLPYLSLKTDGFQALEVMSLTGYRSPLVEEVWFPPSLRRLHIYFELLKASHLYCPTLEELDIPLDVDPEQDASVIRWPSLRVLSMGGRGLVWRDITHRNLRNVTLFRRFGAHHNIATEFCREVALQPSNLPALESLSIHLVPDWDILFIMLEQKNFAAQPGVVRITTLTLPVITPMQFREPLRALLNGKYAQRSSNYELSLVGNADIILDPSM
jgi:hypothetical protein